MELYHFVINEALPSATRGRIDRLNRRRVKLRIGLLLGERQRYPVRSWQAERLTEFVGGSSGGQWLQGTFLAGYVNWPSCLHGKER